MDLDKTLMWGYLVLFFWCAVIMIVVLTIADRSQLAPQAFSVASEGFKVVLGAAIGAFSARRGGQNGR